MYEKMLKGVIGIPFVFVGIMNIVSAIKVFKLDIDE